MTKAVVIVNPTSGKEEGEEYGPEVKRELEKMYSEVELRWTEGEGDATRFAREACREKWMQFTPWVETELSTSVSMESHLKTTVHLLASYLLARSTI